MKTTLPFSFSGWLYRQINSHLVKFFFVSATVCFCSLLNTAGAQVLAVNSGDWNNPATWSTGAVPAASDDVIVSNNLYVTVSANGAVCNSLQLGLGDEHQNGEINFSGTSSLTVSNTIILGDVDGAFGTIKMCSGAVLSCGTISEGYPGISGVFDTNNGTIVFTGLCVLPQNLVHFNNLTINSSTTTLVYSSININGNLTVNTGATLFLTSFTANRTSAGGTLTLANGANLRIAGAGTLPANFSTHSIGSTSTVDYRGVSAQNIAPLNSGQKYGNLTVQGSTKTMLGSITVAGTLLFAGSGTKLSIGNNTLSIEGLINGATTGRVFRGSPGSNLILNGSVERTLFFDQGTPGNTNALNHLTLNHSGKIATLGTSLEVKGILTFTAGKLAIANNTLTLGGTVINTVSNGLVGSSNSDLIFSGTASDAAVSMDQTTDGTTNRLNNLTINSASRTLTLTNALKLSGILQPSSGILASGGNLTLLSSAASTAMVGTGSASGGYITGDVTVERYISAGRKWQLLCVPTTGSQTINAAWQEGTSPGSSVSTGYGTWITTNVATDFGNGFDNVTPGTSIKTYNANTGTFTTLTGTNGPVASTDAYMVFIRGDRGCTSFNTTVSPTILRSTGVLRQGTQAALVVPADKNMTIANAYPSPVDFRLLTKSPAVDDLFYVWDPKLGGAFGLGAYQTLVSVGGNYVITPGGGSYGAGGSVVNTIQPGQGFLVHATGANGTLQFSEAAKSGINQLVSKPLGGIAPQLRINLYSGQTDFKLVDGVLVEMAGSYSKGFDRYDALKIFNNNETFSIASNNLNFSVERRPLPQAADTVFLNSFGLRSQHYRLEIVPSMMETFYIEAWLEDSYLGLKYPLNIRDTNVVQFTATNDPASKAVSRFRVVLKPAVVLPVTFTGISAIQKDTGVLVSWHTAGDINAKQYILERSADGIVFQDVYQTSPNNTGATASRYLWFDDKPVAGKNFYRVKVIGLNNSSKFSKIVVVNWKQPGKIMVFPNPVIDRKVNLMLTGMSKGTGSYFIASSVGTIVASGRIEVNSSEVKTTLHVPRATKPGKYQLKIKLKEITCTTELIVL